MRSPIPIPSETEIKKFEEIIKNSIKGWDGEVKITVGPSRFRHVFVHIEDDLSKISLDFWSVYWPASFYHYLEQIMENLIDRMNSMAKIYNLEKNIKVSKEIKEKYEKSSAWLEFLPFPLATVLWTYESTSEVDDKIEHLHNFFEALSAFIAIILLSSFLSDLDFFKNEIRIIKFGNRMAFKETSIRSWVEMGRWLAKNIRRLKYGKDQQKWDKFYQILGEPDEELLESLSNEKLFKKLEDLSILRNRWKGHSGIKPELPELKERLLKLENYLKELNILILKKFTKLLIVIPTSNVNFDGNSFVIKVKCAKGTRYPFREIEIKSYTPLVNKPEGKLYLLHGNLKKPIEIVPFLRILPSSETKESACYFYNRIDGEYARFVSFHYCPKNELHLPKQELDFVLSILKSD